jgi:serine/threonine protein kinase
MNEERNVSQVDDGRVEIEMLAETFSQELRAGKHPQIADYVRRHPALEAEIWDLFPTIESLERIRLQHDRGPDGRVSLGSRKIECLGDFSIVREIGRGGMGIVYEAEQISLGRRVAVKVLPHNALLDEKHLKRFRREARTAARLHHTNIVPVFGVGEHDGVHYYVMQLIRGVGLDEVLEFLRERHGTPSGGRQRTGNSASAVGRSQQAVEELAGELIHRDHSDPLSTGSTPSASLRPASDGLLVGKTWLSHEDQRPQAATADYGMSQSGSNPSADSPADTPTPSPSDTVALSADGVMAAGSRSDRAEGAGAINRRDATAGEPARAANAAGTRNESGTIRRRHASEYWHSVARIGRQVADALDYAHGLGTLHRDIKPANLLLDGQGTVWVTDFGLARAMDHSDVSRSGDVVGTLRYMAPEQLRGEARIASDIYALGLTLYELLTLEPAFDENGRKKALRTGQVQHEPVRPRKLCPDVPRDLETIVMKCLAFEADRRYTTAGDIAEDLRNYLENRPILARRTSAAEQFWRWCRRNPALASVTALAAILLVAVAVTASAGAYLANKSLQRAEETAQLAMEALDSIYEKLSPSYTSGVVVDVAATDDTDASAYPATEWVQVQASPETAQVLENLLVYYDKLAQHADANSKIALQAAIALRRVGDIRQRLGDYESAEDAYQRTLEKLRELEPKVATRGPVRLQMARTLNELGSLHAVMQTSGSPGPQRSTQSEADHLAALRLLQDADPANADAQFETARTHYLLVSLGPHWMGRDRGRGPRGDRGDRRDREDRRGDRGGPGERGGPGDDRERRAGGTTEERDGPPRGFGGPGGPPIGPPPEDRAEQDENRQHEAAKERRSDSGRAEQDDTDATPPDDFADWSPMQHRQRALAILEKLTSDYPDTPDYQFLLAQCYALPTFTRGPDPERDEQLAQSREILVQLVERYPKMSEYRYELCRSYGNVPWFRFGGFRTRVDLDQVQQQLELGENEAEILVRQNTAVPKYAKELADMSGKLAWLHRQRRNYDESLAYFEKSLQQYENIVETFPQMAKQNVVFCEFARYCVADSLIIQAAVESGEDAKLDRAIRVLNTAADNLVVLRRGEGMQDNGFLKMTLAQVYRRLSEGYMMMSRYDEAAAARDAAKDLWTPPQKQE